MPKHSITILGAGLSGMITALALASKGIKSYIIEKNSLEVLENPRDFRTTALSKASQEILESYNIWDSIAQYSNPISDIYVIDSHNNKSMLHFPSSLVQEEAMGYMIKNTDFRAILFRLIKSHPLIEFLANMEYTNVEIGEFESKIYLADSSTIDSELIIVSDGKFSCARKQLFFNQIDKRYTQKAIIFNIKHDRNHCNSAIEHFLPEGPFAILPLPGGYESSIVWCKQLEVADIMLSKPKEEIKNYVSKLLADCLGEFDFSSPIAAYPLSAALVDKYYNQNVVVIADAAHTIHPLAGQGLNLGIQDISALIKAIEDCVLNGIPFLTNYLEPYNQDRKMSNLQMFFITDFLNTIFSQNSWLLSRFREIGLSVIDSNNVLKSYLMRYAMGKLKIGSIAKFLAEASVRFKVI